MPIVDPTYAIGCSPGASSNARTGGVLFLFEGTETAAAEDAEKHLPDKSGYNLFNPTPGDMMRELTPDRPDKTESPYTVDAGHFQMELSFLEFTRNDTDGIRTDIWNVAPVNFKEGLFNNVDLEFVFDGYLNVRTEDRTAGSIRLAIDRLRDTAPGDVPRIFAFP